MKRVFVLLLLLLMLLCACNEEEAAVSSGNSEDISQTKQEEAVKTMEELNVFKDGNGKFGIKDFEDNILIKPEYDKIEKEESFFIDFIDGNLFITPRRCL